jgi:ATP-dependent RNA helicase RhlB
VNTKRQADQVWGYLQGNGYKAAILSGDVPQTKREALLQQFVKKELPILVATDVAARGLHIEGVTHVFNYDLPIDPEDYVHRIGRTARAGATGDAISFVCETYAMSLPDIEAYIGHKIPTRMVTTELLVPVDPKSCQPTSHALAHAAKQRTATTPERRSSILQRSRKNRRTNRQIDL